MTASDRSTPHPGYWPSPWPVECGGNRRQKAAHGRLDAATGTASVRFSRNDRWNVMVVRREPGAWFVGGTMAAFSGPPPFGWVQRLDPDSLEPVATSPELPCGSHVWCGALLAHADGSIVHVNGSFVHRLDPTDLSVLTERALPVDRSHNGVLVLADGSLLTKDLRLEGQGGTTLTRLAAGSLEVVGSLTLPEGSMGRIAADIGTDGVERVYVPGTEHVWRVVVDGADLVVDDWRARYRPAGADTGLAWDGCISDGACWVLDCGDVLSVRRIHGTLPNGRFDEPPGRALSWRLPTPWSGALRLLRLDLDDPADVRSIEPFGTPGGGIVSPPVHVPEWSTAVVWDSVQGGLAGVDTSGGELDVRWTLDVRPVMQPVVFPDSGELVTNDFTDDGFDDLIVVDLASGELVERVRTGSRVGNGMFLTAGDERDVWYCTTSCLARVRWS